MPELSSTSVSPTKMARVPTPKVLRPTWENLYKEAELYKAAIRVYTKPLFQWRKALCFSSDERTLYDFAAHGLARLDAIHGALQRGGFEYRPAIAFHYNFNGRHRTLYIPPWEERIVDLLLYRTLNRQLRAWFWQTLMPIGTVATA